MKIGIVTVHDSNNYGSFLQAYALQELLQSMGHEVYFARTRDKKILKDIFVPRLFQKKILSHPFHILMARRNGRKKRKAFLYDQNVFKEIDDNELKIMDLVILGSDEIWNVKVNSFQKGIFYGEGLSKVIAYGVSAGRADIDDFQKYPDVIRNIKQMQYILVRDLRTQNIVKQIKGIVPDIVCDPTFLIDSSAFKRQFNRIKTIDKKYVLIYSYGINQALKEKIKVFAQRNNMKVVSACFYYKWADYNFMCGPLDFCVLIEGAEYVITTTFHGTVFSILNKKQFICFPASVKTNDLLTRLGLQSRIMEDDANGEIIQFYLRENKINYDDVYKIILKMRSESIELLRKSIRNMVENDGESV